MSERDYSSIVDRVRALQHERCRVLDDIAGHPVLTVELGNEDHPHIYINAGTHGDEPAGVEAALRFLVNGAERWSRLFRLTVVPCLCPHAWVRDQRHNAQDIDVNWAYLRDDVPEISCVKSLVAGRDIRCVLDLHEDWESPGYYLYEQFNKVSIGQMLIERVRSVCPIDARTRIDGEDAADGVIFPNMNAPKLRDGSGIPISLFREGHTERMITAESPSSLDFDVRVSGHLAAIDGALDHLASNSG